LEANFEKFVSPDTLNWPRSGEMIFMIVLGGMGSLFGPVLGAVVYWLLQDVLSDITEYWQIIFGPLLILVVLFARGGIAGLLNWKRRDA
jgi:branched-chain amino acid transport system permease protein